MGRLQGKAHLLSMNQCGPWTHLELEMITECSINKTFGKGRTWGENVSECYPMRAFSKW